ncbi:MAG TPA: FG-GAP-like repeat-containing protein [Verrucomicrobiae bacterium]|jgi:subtilase family serine protease|nr:FG-GAP-like repeat-containing protein [Verrucomicrobiae bacterium]
MNHSTTPWRAVILCAALLLAISAPAQPARQFISAHVPAAARLAQPLGQMPAGDRLSVAITLPFRNQSALSNLLHQISDPASPNYRHYLTREQFTERFGPTTEDYSALKNFAAANGFRVNAEHANRMLLEVNGAVADIERVFHTTLRTYQHPTEARTFYAPDSEPSLDLAVRVLSVGGMDNYTLARPRLQSVVLTSQANAEPNAGSGPSGTYRGNDFRAAYLPGTSLTGAGQVLGLLQFDGYTPSDIAYYETQAGLPNVPLVNVLLSGASSQPSGAGGEVEVSLDIEAAISMAPGLSQVIVYIAPNPSPFETILNRMVSDNTAKQLSCSWFIPNGAANPATDQIFQEMAMQGQSFFNASGDADAFTGLIDFPGDTPLITQVGGTILSTATAGGPRTSETVWNRYNGVGSGGGISTQYGIPDWQTNINMSANQGSTTMRNIPDVALTGENVYVRVDGRDVRVGGTSCSAPLWASFAALVNQEAVANNQPTIGFINPLLYKIGSGSSYSLCFFDTTSGDNTSSSSPTKFFATPGYDLCTGWGTPAGQKLIDALANPEALHIKPDTGFSSIGGAGGPFTVTSQELSLTNAGTNSLNWMLVNTVPWLNAAPTSGTLNPGDPAATVTVNLNSSASNLIVGTYSGAIYFTNLTSMASFERDYSVSIISRPSVTVQPADQAVLDGATATFSVQAGGGMPLFYQWQLNGTNLTDGGGFAGTETTNLIVTNVSPADVGAYTVVVTNIAGTTTSSNALLSIVDSVPVITIAPSDQTVIAGQTITFTVAAIGTKPFYYQWTYGSSGGTNINGATNATLVFPNVQLTDAGLYSVIVSNSIGAAPAVSATLNVVEVPVITSFNPASGIVGTNVTIAGFNFSSNAADNVVYFGAVQAAVTSASATNLTVSVPAGATFSPISVTVNGLTAFADQPFMPVFPGIGQINSSSVGSIVTFVTGNGPIRVYLADLNNDGKPDLIVSSCYAGVVSVFQNISTNGSLTAGSFGPRVDLLVDSLPNSADPYTLTVVDVDGDGKLDIVACNADHNLLCIFRNIGSPGATITTSSFADRIDLPASNTMRGVAAQDLDGDGKPEIVTGNQNDNDISIFKNNSAPGNIDFAPPVNLAAGSGATTVVIADMDGDGKPDIASANFSGNTISIFRNLGLNGIINSNSFAPAVNFAAPATPFALAIGDIDGDGKLDLVVGGESQSQVVAVYRNTSNPGNIDTNSFAAPVTFAASGWVNFVALADLDGDGKLDLALVTQPSNKFSIFKNLSFPGSFTSASLATRVDFPAGSNPNGVALGDLDGDGRPDVVFGNTYDGSLSVYQNGVPIAAPPIITAQPTNFVASVGNDASFSVTVNSSTPPIYQWYGNSSILGATNSTLTLTNVQLSSAGTYYMVMSNAFGSVTSSNATLTVNTPSCVQPSTNLISWWAGETNTLDGWGANHGFITNGAISYTTGKINAAFHYNGSGGCVEIPATPSLNVGSGPGFTLEGWIRPADLVNQLPVFEWQYDGTEVGVHFWTSAIGGAGCLYANIVDTNNIAHSFFSAPGILNSRYQHVAMTYDQASGAASIYWNGTLVANTNVGFITPKTTANLLLGERTGGVSLYNFIGDLDEMSIYSRALSQIEIQAIYNASSAGKCIVPRPPVIVQPPTNQTTHVGGTANFYVIASGTMPLTYQWHLNSTNDLPGATNSSLTLNNVQSTNAGAYSVTVSNIYDSATSSNAALFVTPPPAGVPTILSFNPTASAAGTNVTITGANFDPVISNNVVYFGAVQAVVTSTSTTSLVAIVPVGATFSPISVTVNALTGYSDQPFLPVFPGAGQFSASSLAPSVTFGTGNGPLRVYIADLNNDGKPDLIVASAYAGFVSIFQNISTNGSLTAGSFAPRVDLVTDLGTGGADPYTLTTADLDGDGKLDIVACNADQNLVCIFRNIGAPGATITTNSFAPHIDLPAGNAVRGVAVQDLDGDGKPEIVTGNHNESTISIFKNNSVVGNIAFAQRVNFSTGAGATTVVIGDVDGDGKPDIASANYAGSSISVFRNVTLGGVIDTNSFAPAVNFTAPATPYGLALGDLDGDGKLDIVVGGESGSHTIGVLRNTATPGTITISSFAAPVSFATPGWVNFVALADMDGDGKLDIALVTQLTDGFSIFKNISAPGSFTASSLATRVDFSSGSNPSGVVLADLDGDGRPDVVFGNAYNNTLSIYKNVVAFPIPPTITIQPTNLVVSVGSNATFSVTADGAAPLYYQWYVGTNSIPSATNSTLVFTTVSATNAGIYHVTVTNLFGSITSSNATLTVTGFDHFAWNPIPSPRFKSAPFAVTIVAQDTTNGTFTNFVGTAMLISTNGVTVSPQVSGNFVAGVWSGTITVPQVFSGLVLQANDGAGHTGLANSIDVVNPPSVTLLNFGNSLLISWPLSPSGFLLETSDSLSSGTWVPASGSPLQFNGQNLQSEPMTGTNQFFRLRFPGP